MQIITGTTDFSIPEETVVSIGKFDGVHKGHMYIIKRMRNISEEDIRSASLLLTSLLRTWDSVPIRE